ncbi:MAG: response regulator [Pseudomonadota bacterium]
MRGHSVTTQLMLLAILPLAVLFIGLTLFHAHNRNVLLDEQFEARVHDLSRGLAARATQSLLAGDMEALDDLAREMVGESNIYGLHLADPMGDPLVKRGHGPKSAPADALRAVFVPLCISQHGEDDHLRIGEAWIWFDQRPVNVVKRQGFWQALALAVLLALVVGGVAWRLATRILRPLRESLDAMRRIGHGIGGVRIAEDADNELRQLQRGVNLLADALETQDRLRAEALRHDLARERAEQAKAVRTLFLAHMSHEIRTPLSALVGFMHLLRREYADQPMTLRGQQYLEAMEQSARHLGELIGDILDFSRIESGKLELRSVPFSAIRLLDEVAIQLAERARAKGLYIDVVSFLDVPERVVSDPLRLRQVLINLLSNAIKFSPRGGIVMRLMLEQPPDERGEGCVLRFEVEDSGPGIPEADRQRLLEAFEQLDAGTERAHEGTGLGLAICRGLVERAGGELRIDEGARGGAMLSFTWPVRGAVPGPERGGLPVRVAVVDDRTSFRQAAYTRFSRLGWSVQLVEGGLASAGWRGLLDRLPDGLDVLALRDPVERGEDGRAALLGMALEGRLRARHVLVCTARDEPDWERRLEHLGATVIRCPASQRDLERAVESLGDLLFHAGARPAADEVGGAAFEGRTILVVDDHPLNREVLGQMLEQAGARVVLAASGDEALARRKGVDAVLLDLHMPGMDGEVVLRELRARQPELPVLMLTADTVRETAERLRREGAVDVLHKPVGETRLFSALATALGQPLPAPSPPLELEGLRTRFWRDEWPSFALRLRAARLAEDGPALHELLHTLAGTAGLVGLTGLADAARRLDETWRAADRTPADGALWDALWQQADEEEKR